MGDAAMRTMSDTYPPGRMLGHKDRCENHLDRIPPGPASVGVVWLPGAGPPVSSTERSSSLARRACAVGTDRGGGHRGAVRAHRVVAGASRRLVPQRCVGPPLDGRVGSGSDPRRAHAVRRVVPVSVPGGQSVPSLPVTAAHPHRHRVAGRRRRHLPLVALPLVGVLAGVGLRGRPAAGSRPLAGGRGSADLTAAVERPGPRVRVGELRLARIGHVGTAVGDVGASVRVGSVLAGGRQGQASVAGRPGARPHDLPAPADRLPRAVVASACSSSWRPGRSCAGWDGPPWWWRARCSPSAWMLVPLLTDAGWTVNDEFSRGTIYYDSFGARKILVWLGTGDLLDRGRLPLITILAGVGLVFAVVQSRRREPPRVLIGLGLVSMVLFFGRPTLGFVIDLLPGGRRSVPAPVHQRGAPGRLVSGGAGSDVPGQPADGAAPAMEGSRRSR